MKIYIVICLFITNLLIAQDIDVLLQEYETTTKKSLNTVDEKLGNVTIYSQKEIQFMQYTTLSDLLKEIPISNLNKNRFGVSNLSLPGSKTDVSGFFRIFINGHELSSNYTMSPSAPWMEFPMDIVDYVEIYRGNSSFSLGSGNGIFFIRIYTKKGSKENSSKLFAHVTDKGSNAEAVAHSDILENGWSYLAYASNVKVNDDRNYNFKKFKNDSDSKYLYVNLEKESTALNIGYGYVDKDNFAGMSLDANPDDAKYLSEDMFVDFSSSFLDDNSLKLNLSYDLNRLNYDELNNEGLALIPVIDFANAGLTIPKEYHSDIKVNKSSALVSKSFSTQNNNLLIGLNTQYKKYSLDNSYSVNFLNNINYIDKLSNFKSEKRYSAFLQDDYRIADNFLVVLNLKRDKYDRDSNLVKLKNEHYRVGAIYTANDNIGFKTFYTKTSIMPSFYNVDFSSKSAPELKNQKYKYYYIESVYADDDLRLSVLFNNIKIEDFIYYTPIGFINVNHTIEVDNWVFDLKYDFFDKHTLHLNYFTTNLTEHLNNSNKGGFVKVTGEYDKFEYFSSLIYRNSYEYYNEYVDGSYNLNVGVTYKVTKDISVSVKAENILDDSTKSLYKEGINADASIGNFTLEDNEPEITLSTEWVF
ncbi:TonB-dependent receptor plug domain-containing protein [Sulfurimonas sp.]|uniref:TonB-dependent receptor plug domain-containing protein n=1 Tax=Sulfurimonas sp. TaxID=2022749 RepID=UPI003563F4B7